jgi:hypothetical protein
VSPISRYFVADQVLLICHASGAAIHQLGAPAGT